MLFGLRFFNDKIRMKNAGFGYNYHKSPNDVKIGVSHENSFGKL